MTDFFDDLERQLVAATPQRPARIRRARARRATAVGGTLVVLLAGGAGIATAVGGSAGEGGPSGVPAGTVTTAPVTPRPAPGPSASTALPGRASYTVAILNGTTVPGLARGVANRLQNEGFKIGNVTNAATQDRAQTTVYYRTPDCVPAATQVAATLRLGDAKGDFALQKAPEGLRALAGDRAKVIVLVGSDQNRAAGP